mmetsp:Transcript_28571/g.48289  ORF Transcript_28571/g.48289 Transcript_28571/m.48289 type:complete len:207 (+) Transcript_28571:138-758(+)|eukprot:CAMPEP_0114424688 /NCGR_PEP_ID=MMETSP0103-20121206/6826_1 /TAXON_ID=37642 ORGANISM="Paraphysomonas imperforata, Strain PA2" /NCGR_SAMPLE_ID=MMETSP0103 /ASSEMBLY_ACC=CAM_ASM_000201 /LENGTH=206 /DNA_ID=CAMNT_0001593455 /DNA_START=98 /DNA_END=718 /DNA_ORIENTATION=-
MSEAATVADFLQIYKEEFVLTPSNKVRSVITGHEMSVSIEVINSYFNSKKYKMATQWHAFNVDEYDYIIPHKSDKTKMWCQLTQKPLNKIPEQILKHVNGKKYIRLKNEQDQIKEEHRNREDKNCDGEGDGFDIDFMQSLADASSDEDDVPDDKKEMDIMFEEESLTGEVCNDINRDTQSSKRKSPNESVKFNANKSKKKLKKAER